MGNLFFRPFVGRLYGRPGGLFARRVLVMGAAHYCERGCADCGQAAAHPACADFTRDVVGQYLSQPYSDGWEKTYTAFVNSVFGRPATPEERRDFFDSIAFANFLQRAEGRDADDKDDALFAAPGNLAAFREVVRDLRPDVVIAWGARVREALPWDFGSGRAEEVRRGEVFRYRLGDHAFTLVCVHHPSAGYPAEAAHRLFCETGLLPFARSPRGAGL